MNLSFSGTAQITHPELRTSGKPKDAKLVRQLEAAFEKHADEIAALPSTITLSYGPRTGLSNAVIGPTRKLYELNGIKVSLFNQNGVPVEDELPHRFWQSPERLVQKALDYAKKLAKACNAQ